MDHQQQQPQPMHDDQNFVATQYAMYPGSEDDTSYLVYPQMSTYQNVVQHPGPPPRGFLHLALHAFYNRDLTCPFPSSQLSFHRANVRE